MTQQGIVKGEALYKIGSAGFVMAALLWLISSLLMLEIIAGNMQQELKMVGERPAIAQSAELLYTLSVLSMLIGMAGVYRSITASGSAWARLGFYLIVVGTAFWTIGYALDVAFAAAAANWIAAPPASKEAAYSAVAALSAISRGTFPIGVVVYWLAFVFLGIGMVRSTIYPLSLGWFVLILGIAGFSIGIVQTFNGRESTFNLFLIIYALTMLWSLVIGIWIARKVW